MSVSRGMCNYQSIFFERGKKMGLLDDLKKKYLVDDVNDGKGEGEHSSAQTPVPAFAHSTLSLHSSADSATTANRLPAGQFVQAKYDALREEVLNRTPLAAAFLLELNSPMAKRIHVDSERFQAAAETVASERNCSAADILSQLAALTQATETEVREYEDFKGGQKAQLVLPKQEALTAAQGNIARLRSEMSDVQKRLEEDIRGLREEAATRTEQLQQQITQASGDSGPILEQISRLELQFDGDIADFRVTADKLRTELAQVLSSAQQFVK